MLTDEALTALSNGNSVLGVYLDFSKAFDTIDHHILLSKLTHIINFTPSATNLIRSYPANRQQITVINNKIFSEPHFINNGVPQGSILGPTWFLIYISDLANATQTLDPILYADDTDLIFEAKYLISTKLKLTLLLRQ